MKSLSLSDAAFACFILSITLLPIGFGGNRDLPFGLAQCGLGLSALLLLKEQQILCACFWPKRIQWALGLFGVVALWGLLQTQSFMPGEWHHPLWWEAEKILHKPLSGSIALWHDEAFYNFNRLITYITAGILAYIFAQDHNRARLMVQALWYSGIAICIYGYISLTTSDTVLWQAKTQYQGDFTASFINKNHYAIYAAMVMLCGTALLYQSWRDGKKSKAFIPLLLIASVFVSIVLSHSRAGLMLSIVGLSLFFFCYQLYKKRWNIAGQIVIASILIISATAWIAGQHSDHFAQLFTDQSSGVRLAAYQLCLQAIADNPWFGYGLGSFQAVFRMYNQAISIAFNHAHSDILESLVDLGLPAGLLLWAAILLLISGLIRGLFKRRRYGIFPALAIASTIMVLSHSAVDFSLQIPGVAMPFAMLLGMGLAQSWGLSKKTNAYAVSASADEAPGHP